MKLEQETSAFHGHSCKEMESKSEKSGKSSLQGISQFSARTDQSMDQPVKFKREADISIRSDRSSSPGISQVSARTDKSMDQPVKFKREADISISEKSDRSSSPGISQVSARTDQSMETPGSFKGEADISISELTLRLLAEDQFKCSLCKDVFTDPVNIPCGHSYCKVCINLHWTEPTQEGDYKCPQCSKAYNTRPELYINGVVRLMLERAKYSPVLPTCTYARPGDLACDLCTGRKLRAMKFCLNCRAAYCENHLKTHYKVPFLQKHQLTEISDSEELGKCLCLKHSKVLDVFCKTDQSHVCSLCALLEHRSHDIEIVDSEKKPSMLPSDPERSIDSLSGALESDDFYRSPIADSTFPQMTTPPTGITSGTSRCSSHDSDSRIPMKRRCNESPYFSPKNPKIVRRLQFNDNQEEDEAERSSSFPILTETLLEMHCGSPLHS